MPQIVLIGPTGSGKTSLASKLSAEFDIPHISSGEIARQLASRDHDTEIALSQGHYAPEEAMRHCIREELERHSIAGSGWVMEGFPRKVEQLIALMSWVNDDHLFVHLAVDEITCIHRLIRRGRKDDNPDSIAKKLRSYQDNTVPMLRLLEQAGRIYELPAGNDDDPYSDLRNLI